MTISAAVSDPVTGTDADAAHCAYRATRHFGSLDGLRFLCIVAVLWHHAPVRELQDAARILTRGFTGVDFFFVLSGYLITTLLLREESVNGRFSLAEFYWRRFLRIIPVYYFVVTLVAVYYILIKGQGQYTALLPFYYLFLSNYLVGDIPLLAPMWSLGVEEQYYLVWPLLLLLVPRRWTVHLLAVLIGVSLLAGLGVFLAMGIEPIRTAHLVIKLPPAVYQAILIGSLTAVVLNGRRGFGLLWPVLSHPAAPLAAFAALILGWQFLPLDLTGWPNFVMHLTMAACLASLVIREDNVLRPVLAWGPVARVGVVSYGIYLYHLIALHPVAAVLGKGGGWRGIAVFVIYALLAWLIAEISFRTLEAFFRRFRNIRPRRRRHGRGPEHPAQ